jgi:hypothetical protein
MTKKQLGRKGFIQLKLSTLLLFTNRCQDWNSSFLSPQEAGADAEAMEGDVLYWLASPGLLSLLSYRTQDYQPRDGTTHKETSCLDH